MEKHYLLLFLSQQHCQMLDPPLKIRLHLPLICLHCHEDNNSVVIIILNDSLIIGVWDGVGRDSHR